MGLGYRLRVPLYHMPPTTYWLLPGRETVAVELLATGYRLPATDYFYCLTFPSPAIFPNRIFFPS